MRAVRLALAGLIGGSFAYPVAAGAHEKWFVDASSPPTSWAAALGPPGILGVAVAIGPAAVARDLEQHRRGGAPTARQL